MPRDRGSSRAHTGNDQPYRGILGRACSRPIPRLDSGMSKSPGTRSTQRPISQVCATLAAENGAREAQLMVVLGWKDPKQAAHYTRKARQKTLAGAAMHLIRLDETANETVPLSAPMAPAGTRSTGK